MILKTEIGDFQLWSTESNDSSSEVVLGSKSQVALEQVLLSIELAGVSEDDTQPKVRLTELVNSIKQRVLPTGELGYTVVVDRATVCLWINFEVLNYLLYDYTGFQELEIANPNIPA